jgi:uncharacterized phage-associated protein
MKKYNTKKFINCVLFFARKTDPNKLGILKLNKLLYYIDFEHYKKYGRSILSDIYIKMEQGPVPSFSYSLFNMAFHDNKDDETSQELRNSVEVKQHKVKDFDINAIYPKEGKEFNETLFSESELEIMEDVAKKYSSKTGTAMSKETHKEDTPWSKTPPMEAVDYDLILDENSVSKDYVDYWKKEEKELDLLLQ